MDVLILNAGVINGKVLEELTEQEIRKTFDVNVLGLYWATKAFLPTMKQRRSGHIVTIASAAGLLGVVRQVDYCATKHAAVGFAESLRVELHRYAPDLRTTLVCPYYINTGMFDGVKSKVGWLLPILEEQDVADKVISAVERDKPELFMPWSVATLPFLRGLPSKLFDRAMDFLGVHASMDEFHGAGRSARRRRRTEYRRGRVGLGLPAASPVGGSPALLVIELGGRRIVETTRSLRVLETSHPPVHYVPIEDIAAGVLDPGRGGGLVLRVEGAGELLRRRRAQYGDVGVPGPTSGARGPPGTTRSRRPASRRSSTTSRSTRR